MNRQLQLSIRVGVLLLCWGAASLAYSSSPAGERRFKTSFNPDRNEFVTSSYSVDQVNYMPQNAKMILRRHNHAGVVIGNPRPIDIAIHGTSESGTHAIDLLNKKILLTYCAQKDAAGVYTYSLQYQMNRLADFEYIPNTSKVIYEVIDNSIPCHHVEAEFHRGLANYLIVWKSNSNLIGQFVDISGNKIGSEFTISNSANSSMFRIVADHKVGGKFYVLYFDSQRSFMAVVAANQVSLPNIIDLPNPVDSLTYSGDLVYDPSDQSLLFIGSYKDTNTNTVSADVYRLDLTGVTPVVQSTPIFGFIFANTFNSETRLNMVLNPKTMKLELFSSEALSQTPYTNLLVHRSFSLDRTQPQDTGPTNIITNSAQPYLFDSKAAVNSLCGTTFLAASQQPDYDNLAYADKVIGPICQPLVSKDQANLTFAAAFVGAKLLPKTIKFRADLTDTPFGSASLVGTHASMFKITADTCSGATVLYKGECSISVAPLGANAGQFEAQLRLPVTGGGVQSVTLKSQFSPPRVIKPISPDAKATDIRAQKTHLIWEATTETQGGQYKVTICEDPNGVDCKALTLPIVRQP